MEKTHIHTSRFLSQIHHTVGFFGGVWGWFFGGFFWCVTSPPPPSLNTLEKRIRKKNSKCSPSTFLLEFHKAAEKSDSACGHCNTHATNTILQNKFHRSWWGQVFCILFWYYLQEKTSPVYD